MCFDISDYFICCCYKFLQKYQFIRMCLTKESAWLLAKRLIRFSQSLIPNSCPDTGLHLLIFVLLIMIFHVCIYWDLYNLSLYTLSDCRCSVFLFVYTVHSRGYISVRIKESWRMLGCKRPSLIQFAGSLVNIQTLSMSTDCWLCSFGQQHTQQCYME